MYRPIASTHWRLPQYLIHRCFGPWDEHSYVVKLEKPDEFSDSNCTMLVKELFSTILQHQCLTWGSSEQRQPSYITFDICNTAGPNEGLPLYEGPPEQWRRYVKLHSHLFSQRMREAPVSSFNIHEYFIARLSHFDRAPASMG